MANIESITTAIARNEIAKFKRLVKSGDVDAVDEDGFTLLMNIALDEDADAEMARHLIGLGADINCPDAAGGGATALAFAVRDNRADVARLLLAAGASATAADAHGNTPLHCAIQAREPNLDLIADLLARGADPKRKNRDGDSPLQMAKWGGSEWRAVVALFNQRKVAPRKSRPAADKRSAPGRPPPASQPNKQTKQAKKAGVRRSKASSPRKSK